MRGVSPLSSKGSEPQHFAEAGPALVADLEHSQGPGTLLFLKVPISPHCLAVPGTSPSTHFSF